MRDALKTTGRPIVFSHLRVGPEQAVGLGHRRRATSGAPPATSATAGRACVDICKQNAALAPVRGPGPLERPGHAGGRQRRHDRRPSTARHFSLWAMMAAPLLIGTDLRKASRRARSTILQQQGRHRGRPGPARRAGQAGSHRPAAGVDVFVEAARQRRQGRGAVQRVRLHADDLDLRCRRSACRASSVLKDLWTKSTRTTTGAISASVPSLATVIYRVSKDGPAPDAASGVSDLSAFEATSSTNGWGPVEIDRSRRQPGRRRRQDPDDQRCHALDGLRRARGPGRSSSTWAASVPRSPWTSASTTRWPPARDR